MFSRVLSTVLCLAFLVVALSPPSSRTTPPSGALVVRQGTTTPGEFSTFASAVAALPANASSQTIFIFPGTYEGQTLLQRSGPVTILGYSAHPANASANTVVFAHSIDATRAGSNDLSGTLRVHTDDVRIYNIDIRNEFGPGSQAIALSNYGNRVGLYACRLFGYQDTFLTNQGMHAFLQGYIEGATDFIFGQHSVAYFEGNTIGVKGKGFVTADGRSSNDTGIYLFKNNVIALSPNAFPNATGNYHLGRPWGDFARVVFISTTITAPIEPALWSIWHPDEPNTDNVFYADFNTTGSGLPGDVERPGFATVLSASEAEAFTIESVLGGDYAEWVDADYLLS
ncbi:carbohydrate esterase family 8 protein [Amylostereum chailletii]|nr:carbohydrate esterase family 8 protein [Amylostereum chailletii]